MAYKTINSLDEFTKQISEGKTFVDFYADWCGPCKMLAPFFEQLSDEVSDVTFVKVDVDQAQEIAMKYSIMSIPALFVFENGEIKEQGSGFMPKDKMAELLK